MFTTVDSVGFGKVYLILVLLQLSLHFLKLLELIGVLKFLVIYLVFVFIFSDLVIIKLFIRAKLILRCLLLPAKHQITLYSYKGKTYCWVC